MALRRTRTPGGATTAVTAGSGQPPNPWQAQREASSSEKPHARGRTSCQCLQREVAGVTLRASTITTSLHPSIHPFTHQFIALPAGRPEWGRSLRCFNNIGRLFELRRKLNTLVLAPHHTQPQGRSRDHAYASLRATTSIDL